MFSIVISLEQHRKSEEKFKIFTSEKDESQVKVQAITKERDEFAKLALERGKALEVSQLLLVGLNIELVCDRYPERSGQDPFNFEMITKSQMNTELFRCT